VTADDKVRVEPLPMSTDWFPATVPRVIGRARVFAPAPAATVSVPLDGAPVPRVMALLAGSGASEMLYPPP
jgi:hypothetical protein